MAEDRLYDVATVAQKLSISKATVYRMIELGQLPAHRMGLKYGYRIAKGDLEKFIAERENCSEV
ncbi:MAG: helix-turn-helix domain-containing protein [Desulfovermiculus sp.]